MIGRTLGGYRLESVLGRGPHGTVYRAVHVGQERAFAFKVIEAAVVEPRALEPFARYAPGLTRVRHPGIARFVEMVQADGLVGLVSELVEGTALSQLLKEDAFPNPKKAWDIVKQLLEALNYAHVHGAVHRNLKPGNLVLAADGHLSVCDFGTAILFSARDESSVEHYSPEHFRRGKITAASDLYQVGALAYQLMTGKLPFPGTVAEIRRAVTEDKPIDPSGHNKSLAWQLDFVLQKAMAKAPERRYPGALEFAEGMRLGLQDTIGRQLDSAKPLPSGSVELFDNDDDIVDLMNEEAAEVPVPAAPAAQASPLLENARILAATQVVTEPPAPIDAAKPTVLFVDDEPRILNSLTALFRGEYNVRTAEGGGAALEILGKIPVQVIVSDQRMPGLTGVELLRKARDAWPNTVRILLTGYTDLASLVGSINQGEIFRFVMKPWDNDDLRKAVAEGVERAAGNAAAPPAAVSAPRSAGSLLVIDSQEGVARGLERLLSGAARVILVPTVAEAAQVIKKEEVAAIVADIGTGMNGLVALFRELKAKRPGVLSILLTDEPDAALAIELVNRAHVFRLMPKPVSARELRTQVAEALRRYSIYKQNPVSNTQKAGTAA